ncbi:glycosyltransferase family 4 protein [Mucilaginibacter pedocola]|uniref:Glycosyl transferase family 1 domain-containing protein n=1 Tax=Mucilaginibacter pedocola TaxID=1792845 RepID=A0A1S9P8B5_9SPHI|nr:glycosyltransferase family 4 protein [Mucilaginibacter pedocola]OOQ57087.1 hypothetical protein BC343_16285 [Mucilaginibacter pedocola]
MKVVIINNDFRVYWKGRLVYLREYLPQQGMSLNAVELFGKGSPYGFDSVTSTEDWWQCLFPDKSAADVPKEQIKAGVFAALDKINPDVVIGPSIVFFAGALAIAWAKKRRKRFIMFDDARPTQVKRNFIVQWVKDLITSNADGFWLPAKSYDTDYLKFKQQGLHFFYGLACINNSFFSVDNRPANTKAIICVARLVPIKNLDGLLKAWQVVEQQNTGYKLIIVGNGPEGDALTQQAAGLKLQHVEFVDAVDNKQLPVCFARADAFVLPSFSETWGLVVNEAMAAGLPVLLSATVNAANDLLRDAENGYKFNAFDNADIAAKLLQYIALSPGEKAAMGQQSLRIIDTMSYEKMGGQLVAAINTITAAKYKAPGIAAAAIIARWHGRYNTSGWDKL